MSGRLSRRVRCWKPRWKGNTPWKWYMDKATILKKKYIWETEGEKIVRPKKNTLAAMTLVAKDLLENNQSVADIGTIVGALGEDSLKWLKDLKAECATVDEFIKLATKRADIALIVAAVKCALGYEYQETDQHFIKVPAGYDEAGIPKMREERGSKKVKTKRALPNEALLRFILKCRLPEYFQDVQRVEINKKTIEIKEIAGKQIEEFGRKFLEMADNENQNSR